MWNTPTDGGQPHDAGNGRPRRARRYASVDDSYEGGFSVRRTGPATRRGTVRRGRGTVTYRQQHSDHPLDYSETTRRVAGDAIDNAGRTVGRAARQAAGYAADAAIDRARDAVTPQYDEYGQRLRRGGSLGPDLANLGRAGARGGGGLLRALFRSW